MAWMLLYEGLPMAKALEQAASNLSWVYSFPRLIIPMQDLKPCCGCDLLFITASTVWTVALPVLEAQLIIL